MGQISLYSVIYLLLTILALVLLYIYTKAFKDNLNKNGLIMSVAIFVIIFGHLILSLSKVLWLALTANRIIYLGSIVLLVETYIVINYFSNGVNNKTIINIIIFISGLIFLLVASGGTSITLYYESVSLDIQNGLTTLNKVYGPMHQLYSVYVGLMFVLMISRISYSLYKKIIKVFVSPTVLILLGSENVFTWIVERLIHSKLELLTISYIITEIMFILLFKNDNEFKKMTDLANNKQVITVEAVVDEWTTKCSLTERERQILELLIDNVSRADIAKTLFISEHTVKKHTANLYEKLCVTSRNELLYKLNEEICR